MKILIIKFGALGDVLRTSYFLKPLIEKYNNAQIYWLTSKNSIDLLRNNPFIFRLTDKIADLFQIKFDWMISLDDEVEILKKLNEIYFEKITGSYLNTDWTIIYSDDSSLWFDMGLISKYGKQKADELKKKNKLNHTKIFSKILKISKVSPYLFNSPLIENRSKRLFSKKYFHFGINSGAGDRWQGKAMIVDEVIELVKILIEKRINGKEIYIHLLGGEKEFQRNKNILVNFNNKNVDILDTSESVLEFAAIIKYCNYILTSDSLALHLAIAQGVPNLSFFAPTSAAEIDTFGTGVKVISTSSDYCNYSSDCDNSSITASRVFKTFKAHIFKLKMKVD